MRSKSESKTSCNSPCGAASLRWVGRLTSRLIVAGGFIAAVILPLYDVSAQSVMEGVRRYEAGDYSGAIEEWLPLAEAGNASALFNMGQVYRLGRGVSVDPAMAEVYYRRAAELGHVEAMSNLATLLYFGDNAQDNKAEAISFWQRAGRLGDARSQYMLGALYFNGDGVPRNNVQAYAWTLLAIDGGSADAVESGKVIRRYLSEEDQRQAVALAPTLLDREAIAAGRQSSAAASPILPAPATSAGPAPAPQRGGRSMLDLSRPPEALEGGSAQSGLARSAASPAAPAQTLTENPPAAEEAASPQTARPSTGDEVTPTAPGPQGETDGPDEPAPEAGSAMPTSATPADAAATTPLSADQSGSATAMPDPSGPAQPGGWSVQLGAFRDVMTAQQERDRLSARYPDLLADSDISIVRADLGPARGVYYRLRAGAFASRAEAEIFCARLTASGAACVVAPPEG